MVHHRQAIAVALILIVSAAFRLTGLDWDGYQHYHPDERYITWVAITIEAPADFDLASALTPHRSTFNPFYWPPGASSEGIVVLQDQPRSFAYGHVPLYLGVLATRFTEWLAPPLRDLLPQRWPLTMDLLNGGDYNEFHHLTAVARALTALFDVGTVFVVYLLGRHMYGRVVGLLAAAFLAVNVMHVQLAHFFTVDPYLTFFTVSVVYFAVRALHAASNRRYVTFLLLAGGAIGLAVGSKFSAILLILPMLVAIWLRGRDHETARTTAAAVVLATVLVVFAVTNPFALLDWSCDVITPRVAIGPLTIPALDWRSCYLDNVLRQSAMVRGDESFDFTRQYVGTMPYVYPILMQLRWGMGYFLGVAAFGGFAWALVHGARALWENSYRTLNGSKRFASASELVVLAWTLSYFVVTGSFFAKFMRYMQPLTPFLMVYAAAALWRFPRMGHRRTVVALVLGGTLLYALAFVNMYQVEHPWNVASRWLYEHAQPDDVIATEVWDDPLPSSMFIDGEFRNRHIYDYTELNWLTGIMDADDLQKLKLNLSRLAQADYVTLSSNRGYGVVSRLDDLYPLSHQYYERLFAGELGFDVVQVTGRSPRLGTISIWPDRFGSTGLELPPAVRAFLASHADITAGRADESFTVYDQPMAIILRNQDQLTVDEMLSLFELP